MLLVEIGEWLNDQDTRYKWKEIPYYRDKGGQNLAKERSGDQGILRQSADQVA